MKKLKVSIRDEHTLELQEDGHTGDLIDLTSLHDIDIDQSTIKSVVASIKKDVFEAKVEEVRKNYEERQSTAIKLAEANLKNITQMWELCVVGLAKTTVISVISAGKSAK